MPGEKLLLRFKIVSHQSLVRGVGIKKYLAQDDSRMSNFERRMSKWQVLRDSTFGVGHSAFLNGPVAILFILIKNITIRILGNGVSF